MAPSSRIPSLVHPDLDHACDAASRAPSARLWGLVPHPRGYRLEDTARAAVPEQLIGFTAPDAWAGVVIGSTGTMRHLDAAHDPVRIRIGYALDRDGRAATRITGEDGTPVVTTSSPPVGRLPDIAHRILRLPCEPEPTSPLVLMVSAWLVEVLDLATDPAMDGWTDDWLAVADLHPAADLCTGRTPDDLTRALELPGAIPTWEEVRAAAIELGAGLGGLDRHEVSWLDAGSLARFLLDDLPSPAPLLAGLSEVVPSDVASRIAACVIGAASVDARWRAGEHPASEFIGPRRTGSVRADLP